jgi:hypothetical protein
MTPKTKSCGKRCAWRRIDGPYGTRCGGPVRGILDQFPATSPSVGYLFGQETVAGATSDGRSAPIPDLGMPCRSIDAEPPVRQLTAMIAP